MTNSDANKANITIPVDLTNPGQFFACCGLLELADRLWPAADVIGGFSAPRFQRSLFCVSAQVLAQPARELARKANVAQAERRIAEPISAQPVPKSKRRTLAHAARETGEPIQSQLVTELNLPILPQAVAEIPWYHNVILLEKVKDADQRLWYVAKTLEHGWSRAVLTLQIESDLYARQGKAISNFAGTLPAPQSDLAQQSLKDPYVFDFLTLQDEAVERELKPALHRRTMMAKRKTTKRKPLPKTNPLDPLRAALRKRTKDELIGLVLEWAGGNRPMQRELESRFAVEGPDEELAAQTRQAIADATDFDEREINYNFDYDYGAYETIERKFQRMVKAGHLEEAMELALELMRSGSYQVEMSDEGLMTEDVERCLRVVLRGVEASKLPPPRVVAWCDALRQCDRVGFILTKEINALRNRWER